MGQANLKGKTFEERKAFAIARDAIKPFPHVNIIKSLPLPRIPPGYALLMSFFAIAKEMQQERNRDFWGPVKVKK